VGSPAGVNLAAAAPAAVLALGAAAVAPRTLTGLMAASAAVIAALRPAPEPSPEGLEVWTLVAALALGLAASAFEAAAEATALSSRIRAGWTAAVAGLVWVATLIAVDGGRILRWRYGMGAGERRLELPGAALVLGLALLVTLAGSLVTAAHGLARAPEGYRAGRIGQSLLVLGAGLGALGVAVAAGQAFSRSPEGLAAGARDLAAMLLAVGVLVWALVRLIVATGTGTGTVSVDAVLRSDRILRLAAAAAMLAAATAGAEGWRADGTYATAMMAGSASAALLGLVAVQPTRLGLARTALFVLGLLAALSRAA